MSLGPTTAAPAPSAKMNALERSSWLVKSDSRSTPITSAYVDAPVRTSESAMRQPVAEARAGGRDVEGGAPLVPSSLAIVAAADGVW